MFKEIITKDRNTSIYFEYDKEKYDIEYVETKNMIILRRLSDNQILEIFSDKIGFIVQCDTDEQTNFLVTDYSNVDENKNEQIKFKHYIDRNSSDSLYLKNEFECNSIHLESCRITDCSYLVEQSRYGGSIYNLDKNSKRFEQVYNDKQINEIIGDNTLLVSEKLGDFCNSKITDTITYGINPETFEITTPIWSELQQREISVYTKEQVDEINEKLREKGCWLNTKDYSLGDITIYLEVEECLAKLAVYHERPKSVYLDIMHDKINEDFVKKFVKK